MLKSTLADVQRGVGRVGRIAGLKEACMANLVAIYSAKLSPFPGFL
jgi:hypothetical protein